MMMPGRRRLVLSAAGVLFAVRDLQAQRTAQSLHIAMLEDATEGTNAIWWSAFWARLRELGYVEGPELRVSTRHSQGSTHASLSKLALELVALKPDVIVTSTTPATLAAMRATSTIPIIFNGAGAPVEAGLVGSLARPAANVTGISIMSTDLSAKWLDMLAEIVPRAKRFAFLGQSSNPAYRAVSRSLHDVATSRNATVRLLEATSSDEIDRAFEVMVMEKIDAFMVAAIPVILPHRRQIIDLAARHRLAAVYARYEYVEDGGLLSLSPDRTALYRRTADYVQRILQGARPSELPVEQPTKFELVVNLKTAKALGLDIPQTLLLRADRTI
jgi:putative ABC transport system substrate-binding protein